MNLLTTIGALALAAQAPAGLNPKDVDAYIAPQQKVEVAPGRKINLVCMGSGDKTVLFDAGGSDWSVIWALVQPKVARLGRACAYDRAGLGYSDAARGPRTPIAIVEDMRALVKAAELKGPLTLVGHSLGGFNVKLYAALYPEDVAALVLVDPSEERDWDRTRELITSKFGRALAIRSELLDRSFAASLMQRYRDCADAAANGPLEPASLTYRRCSDPVRPQLGPAIAAHRQRLQVSRTYQEAQSSEILNSIYGDRSGEPAYERLFQPGILGRKPLIVLTHGSYDADDPLDALGQAQFIALHRQTTKLSEIGVQRTVEGSGHNIPVEAPDAVVKAVADVLGQLPKARGLPGFSKGR
jgi:pimeloyl-ACP methyl ester carboxylesterase